MKTCFLVLTHKPIPYLLSFAKSHPEYDFYIHVDVKVQLEDVSCNAPDNVYFIEKRVDVKWAGFSMVRATLNLIDYALSKDSENQFFHFISGDDLILQNKLSWTDDTIYMECINSRKHAYRMRFYAPHADNSYTRHPLGKLYTQVLKLINRMFPTKKEYKFGSQWFSIRRAELLILYQSITEQDTNFFKKKLCPDEHFFQYLIEKNQYMDKLSIEGNKRYIVFRESYQRGSSPIFLNLNDLEKAQKNAYWFARKVDQKTMAKFYKL